MTEGSAAPVAAEPASGPGRAGEGAAGYAAVPRDVLLTAVLLAAGVAVVLHVLRGHQYWDYSEGVYVYTSRLLLDGHDLYGGVVAAQPPPLFLVGAGLLVRSFASLQHVRPGFDATSVMTFELSLTGQKYATGPIVANTYRDLWQHLERVPGVTAAGGVTSLPLSGYFAWGPVTVEGRTPPPGEQFLNADQRVVAGRYFESMKVPLLRGRLFDEHDTPDRPRVTIVDEFMASELWPGQDAIGKRIRANKIQPWREVVGVVGDERFAHVRFVFDH